MKTKLFFTLSFIISSFLTTTLSGFAPPANDDCVAAIELTDLENCNEVHVNLAEATSNNLPGSNVPNEIDVWYKFTAPTNSMRLHGIELNYYTTNSIGFEVYEASCPSTMVPLVSQFTYHNHEEFIANLDIGEVYYFRVMLTGGVEADFCLEASCTLEIVTATPSTCNPTDNTYDLDVELAYLGGTTGENITFHIDDFQDELTFNGVDDTLLFTLTDLPASGTSTYAFLNIYNSLDRYCRADYQNLYTEPVPCVDPPVNDSCHQATLISDLTTCNQIHIDLNGATVDSLHGRCDEEVGIWYKFTAISNAIEIDVLDVNSYGTDRMRFDLYEDVCSAEAIFADCMTVYGESSKNLDNLVIGKEYFLRVFLFRGVEADICVKAACELEIISYNTTDCNEANNTYSLEVEVGSTNISVGDTLILRNFSDESEEIFGKYELTTSSDTTTYIITGLNADNLTHYLLGQVQGTNVCSDAIHYTSVSPCIPAPANDSCHQAEILNLATCDIVHVDLRGATMEDNVNSCRFNGAIDVWYQFTAIAGSVNMNIVELDAYKEGTTLQYQIYEGTCSQITQFDSGCSGPYYGTTINGLTIGETYLFRIMLKDGLEADICFQAPCSINITSQIVTTCDNGDNTYDLTVDVSGENLLIGDSLVLNVSGYGLADTGFKITNSSQNFTFTKIGLPSTGNPVSLFVHEWVGSCNAFFNEYYTAPSPCVSAPLNDECGNAISVLNLSTPDTFHVSSLGATPSSGLTNSCFDNTSRDVWYKFTAASTRIGIRGIDFSNNNIQEVEIYEDGCNATIRYGNCFGTCEGCYVELVDLTIGAEYYMRFPFYQAEIEADISIENLCDYEILDISMTACNASNNTYDLTVEFSLTNEMIGDELAISVNNSYITQTITSIENSYTFNINGLPATNAHVSITLLNTTQNNCYESFFQYYTAPDACVSGPPNDDCAGAINIPDLTSCNILHFNNYGATEDNFSFCQSGAIGTWYQFTANTSSIIIKGKDLNNDGFNELLGVQAYEGTCDGLNLLNCSGGLCEDNCDFLLDDLAIGQVYYLLFHSPFIIETDFCIEALDGNICNEHPLLLNMATTNEATYQTQQTITAEGMIPNTNNTTFIAEQSITLMPGFHAQAGATFHAYIEDCTPASPLVETPAEVRTTAKVSPPESSPMVQDLTVAPNPFRYSTNLTYILGASTPVNLRIYNMSGQLVQELVTQETQQAGIYEYTFEPKADAGNFYFAVMTTPEQVITKKMIFIR